MPPAVIVDHDGDVIRIVEGRGTCGRTWRHRTSTSAMRVCQMSLAKSCRYFVVAVPAAIRRKIELIPPLELGARRQRNLAGGRAADQIAAHGDERLAAFGPERRDDVGRPRSPIKTGDDRLLDLESIHQRDDVESDHGLLAVPERFLRRGSASCRSRADKGRSPGSPPTPARARHRRSCECRRASRAEE